MLENILVAVAWPYANGPRHIGHVAGFGVPDGLHSRVPLCASVSSRQRLR